MSGLKEWDKYSAAKRAPKLAADDDPSNPMHFKDDATAEELRAEIERRLNILQEAGILELKVIETPEVQ